MLLRKKIYQISLAAAIFVFGSLFSAGAALAEKTNEIKVEIWSEAENKYAPLCQDEECKSSLKVFDTDNFLPGDTAERKVKITNEDVTGNGSGAEQEIAVEAINASNPFLGWPFISDRFGDILNFKVEEVGGAIKYEKTLSEFFKENGEVVIAKLGNNDNEEFIFSVYFNDTGDNKYQKRSLGFDIIFGLKGNEGGAPPSSGGGGGGLPPGLTISQEPEARVFKDKVIITWLTSYKSTSRVIYDENLEVFALNILPNYGYQYSTLEFDNVPPISLNGVTYHEVEITEFSSGTKYYYRTVSHASPPTISREYSFTTLALSNESEGDKKAEAEAKAETGESEEASEYLPPSNDENAGETGGEISFRTSPVPKTSDVGNSAGNSSDLTNSGNVLGASSNPESAEKNVLNGGSAPKPFLAGAEDQNTQNDSARANQDSFDNFIFLALALIIIGLILYIIKLKKNQKKNV